MGSDKPDHLGSAYGAQFSDPSVAAMYHLRPPYPAETFSFLAGLSSDPPRAVLDVGTGMGEIARGLLPYVDRIDAVDPSAEMIARGRRAPGGDSDRIRWIHAPAESAPLTPPYVLVTAGASLHWMEWSVVMPRFREVLAPDGALAIVGASVASVPWQAAVQTVIDRYSTNRLFRPYELIEELERRDLFRTMGRHATQPVAFSQSLEAYVGSFHARNGFSLDRMAPEDAAAFDREAAAAVAPYAVEGQVTLQVSGDIVWGQPAPV